MQQKVFFVIIFSFLFSPGIIGALGVDKYSSDSSSAAPLSSPKLLVCVHSCYSLLMCYDGVLLGSWRILWVRGVFFLSVIIYWTICCFSLGIHCLKLFYNEILSSFWVIEIVRNCICGCGKGSIRYEWTHLLLNSDTNSTNSTCIHLNRLCLYMHED